jgi:hypothetical protein
MTEFMASLQAQQVQQMQLAQQTQLQQMQAFTQLERDFMLKQIDSLSKKDTGIDQMLKFKQLFDTITGKDEGGGEQRETWEKIMDRINDSVPGIVAAAGLLRGSAPQAAAPQPAPQPRVLPGSVAVVDVDDDEDDRVPMQRRNPRRRRRLQPPAQARTASSSVQTAPTAAASPVVEAGESVNDFTDFVFPQEDTPVEQSLEMLVKDIDLAIQHANPDAETIAPECFDLLSRDLEQMKAMLSRKEIILLEKQLVLEALEGKVVGLGEELEQADVDRQAIQRQFIDLAFAEGLVGLARIAE